MKYMLLVFSLLGFLISAQAYQVTGPVLETTPNKIVVQKGTEKWELARDADTKVPDTVKVGDKVTVEYKMTATNVEVKAARKK